LGVAAADQLGFFLQFFLQVLDLMNPLKVVGVEPVIESIYEIDPIVLLVDKILIPLLEVFIVLLYARNQLLRSLVVIVQLVLQALNDEGLQGIDLLLNLSQVHVSQPIELPPALGELSQAPHQLRL